MKNVLLCGGCGFVGTNLLRHLLQMSSIERITIYDNLSSGAYAAGLTLKDKRIRFYKGEIADEWSITNRMHGHDTVFHLAANADIAKAATEPSIDFVNGTLLTNNILEAMRKTGAQKIFYMSGSGVYGDMPGISPCEDHGPCRPISPYGASKLASEAMICAYSHILGITGLAFRCANIVGPHQTHGVGFDFVNRLKKNRSELTILGDGTQTKSYVHIDDVISAMMIARQHAQDGSYDVFNVATPTRMSVQQIADMAAEVAGCTSRPMYRFSGGKRGWRGDVPDVSFSCIKMWNIGWRPKYTSAEAMMLALKSMV